MKDSSFDFVDLFAGLGGFHVALESLGGQAVFAAEWDPTLADLYAENFGIKPWGDVTSIIEPSTAVPDHDFLTAGFPCQPFSKAGEQLGFAHTEQGRLFFKVAEILEAKTPNYFILENVPNILRHKSGKTLEFMLQRLAGIGYDVDYHRLSPHSFGIPQVRDRAYFIGSKKGLGEFNWPTPTHESTSILSVLDSHPTVGRSVPKAALRAIDAWGDFLRSAPPNVKLPSFPIWSMEFGATYPFESLSPAHLVKTRRPAALRGSRSGFGVVLDGTGNEMLSKLPSHAQRPGREFPQWKKDFIRQNRDFYLENNEWIDPWIERNDIASFHSSHQKFEWNVQGGRRNIEDYVIQMRASGVRVKRPTTAPSLIAMTYSQVPILGWERRYMTPEECARLQSLGGIKLPGSDLAAYKALGNAVNSRVVRAVAGALLGREG